MLINLNKDTLKSKLNKLPGVSISTINEDMVFPIIDSSGGNHNSNVIIFSVRILKDPIIHHGLEVNIPTYEFKKLLKESK